MVSTIQVQPSPLLQPFISCYALRIFDTGEWSMPKPMHAVQEFYMTFFLKERFCGIVDESGKLKQKVSNSLCTLFTQPNGCTYWKGDYRVFCVQFTSNGMSAIFGIPQKQLIDMVLPVNELLGDDNRLLTEQLYECEDITEMSGIMNAYLIKQLLRRKHKTYTATIACMSNIILQKKGCVSLDKLVYQSNMSFRNFERRFTEEVGLPPKLYARITRFYNAVENKTLHPQKKWTDITYENGYFDQAHLIKEWKEFSGKTPESLFTLTPPPKEDFIAGI